MITLAEFMEIISLVGPAKLKKIAEIKNRPPYHPRKDFYKPIREHIIHIHRTDQPKSSLGNVLNRLTDKKKQNNYVEVIKGYTRWWGSNNPTWFTPKSGVFSAHGLQIRVNPELGLTIAGNTHIVKMHLKLERLNPSQANLITHMMEYSLRPGCPNGEIMSVLDVRRGKLVSQTTALDPRVSTMLKAELAYVANVWPYV